MKKLMGEQLNHREIDEILRDVDLNGDGQVDFEGELSRLWARKQQEQKHRGNKAKEWGEMSAKSGTRYGFEVKFLALYRGGR